MDKLHRHIDILLFDGVNILDVAGMAQAFSSTNELADHTYSLRYVSSGGTPVTASCGMQLQVDGRASRGSKADDLALSLIRRDCGVSTALQVAREMVVYLHRTGGQMQFSDLLESQFSRDQSLRALIDMVFECPQKPWTLESMAQVAGLTPRTLSRRFAKSYTTSPVKFLERLRVKTAADLLGVGTPVGKAITLSGFYDFQQMQRAFKRHLGTTIGAYRDRFAPHEKGAID